MFPPNTKKPPVSRRSWTAIRLPESSPRSCLARTQTRAMLDYVREGIEIAKAQGKYTGRKPIPLDWMKFSQLYGEWKSKNITGRDFMRRMGLTANTFYRRVREYESNHHITEPTTA